MPRFAFFVALVATLYISSVHPHGLLKDPPARNWMWHTGQFPDQPPHWNPSAVECGGENPQDEAVSNCGMCGDNLSNPRPRDNEHGGLYGKGFIAKTYTAGSRITLTAEMYASHNGYFEVHLCSSPIETPECFVKLPILSGSTQLLANGRICVPGAATTITAVVQLPAGVRCERCTLRWTYRTAYPGFPGWTECAVNPNLAQVFRNCADVRIN